MTITADNSVALRRGRDLVSPELFEKLSVFCADEYGHELSMARRVMNEALAFLWVVGTTGKGEVMAPSAVVDPGWHAFMLHTQEYADWCAAQFGYFLHHAPNSKIRTRGLMVSMVEEIRAAGFDVDITLWGTTADCNSPACCGDGPCC
ncbi:hypothetical protein Q5762_18150 [Streptomyces sp. P9(2023)]|uniref:glycine-rich domain-containing protein n=1 Tax=Streptomyces sp. P9(2023) TaxID=3064394 RepID=UPI0028F40072|nr:hypothetical protein [Streptomyces sp. P9(2023)]MDT9690228.1 hypothetical protein [Streptomyces sp. P9(2023)]